MSSSIEVVTDGRIVVPEEEAAEGEQQIIALKYALEVLLHYRTAAPPRGVQHAMPQFDADCEAGIPESLDNTHVG